VWRRLVDALRLRFSREPARPRGIVGGDMDLEAELIEERVSRGTQAGSHVCKSLYETARVACESVGLQIRSPAKPPAERIVCEPLLQRSPAAAGPLRVDSQRFDIDARVLDHVVTTSSDKRRQTAERRERRGCVMLRVLDHEHFRVIGNHGTDLGKQAVVPDVALEEFDSCGAFWREIIEALPRLGEIDVSRDDQRCGSAPISLEVEKAIP
jgi:hypothetical protein